MPMIASVTHVWVQIDQEAAGRDVAGALRAFWVTLQERSGAVIFKRLLREMPVKGEPIFTFTPERERRHAPQSVLVVADPAVPFRPAAALWLTVTYRLRNNSRITYEHRFEAGTEYLENRA